MAKHRPEKYPAEAFTLRENLIKTIVYQFVTSTPRTKWATVKYFISSILLDIASQTLILTSNNTPPPLLVYPRGWNAAHREGLLVFGGLKNEPPPK